MRVEVKGQGEVEFTIIGSIHGDEPAGKKAIERILKKDFEYSKAVKFIIANEKALEQDERFLDVDLNRSFPGSVDSSEREERLAAKLLDEIGDTKVLDLHTTHSFDKPFANTKSFEGSEMEMVRASGVGYATKFSGNDGRLTDFALGIVVETGIQHSDQAVENAVEVIKNFLAYYNVINQSHKELELELFEQKEKVEGDWEFLKKNFQKVEQGEVYARKDGKKLVAEEEFYPVLMSTNGYDGVLGHKASKI